MRRRPTSLAGLVLGAAALAAVLLLGAWLLFQHSVYEPTAHAVAAPPAPPPPPPPAVEPAPPLEEPSITAVTGLVERTAPGGAWVPVQPGEPLRVEDAVRTGVASRADLAVGAGTHLTIAEGTQVSVREATAAVQSWKLVRGRVGVDHRADGARTLRVETEGGGAAAETLGGRFSVLAAGDVLAVATETGSVDLTAAGRRVRVEGGQQATARPGQGPSAPTPIPVDLLLRIAAAHGLDPELCTVVRGVTDPGAELLVDGERVEVAADGRFAVPVRRHPGVRYALVVSRDAGGRTVERRVACVGPPPEQAISGFSVRWKRGHGL